MDSDIQRKTKIKVHTLETPFGIYNIKIEYDENNNIEISLDKKRSFDSFFHKTNFKKLIESYKLLNVSCKNVEGFNSLITKLIDKKLVSIKEVTNENHSIDHVILTLKDSFSGSEESYTADIELQKRNKHDQIYLINKLYEVYKSVEELGNDVETLSEKHNKLDQNNSIKNLSDQVEVLTNKEHDINGAIETLFVKINELDELIERVNKLEKLFEEEKEKRNQQRIKILQINPKLNTENQLEKRMETEKKDEYENSIIHVDSVFLDNFNNDPYKLLKLEDKWNYDIIRFGMCNENEGITLEEKAVNATEAFIKDGGKCFLDNDNDNLTWRKSEFNKLKEYFGLKIDKYPYDENDNQRRNIYIKLKIIASIIITAIIIIINTIYVYYKLI